MAFQIQYSKYLLLLLLVVGSEFSYGQSVPRLLKIAEELDDAGRYIESIEFYKKAIGRDRKNTEARYKLGLAQMNTLQYAEAKKSFVELYQIPNHSLKAKALYHYAFILKLESEYHVADSLFNFMITSLNAAPDWIELAGKQKAGCQLALAQEKRNRGFNVLSLDNLNSKFHDFGATTNPRNGNLVFATTRTISGDQFEGSQYIGLLPDLVSFKNTGKGRWRNTTSKEKFNITNSKWSEGSGTFTSDGNTFYFSSCKGAEGSQCEIFVSYFKDQDWTEPALLNGYINEIDSENKQPSISFSGDTLFFVSNRVGGYGGTDIWMSLKGLREESWSPAINMGEVINTIENEISPYYSSSSGSLIFSSNGQIGYGGYDLYLAKGKSFFEPEIYNLGAPFNSASDDLYFSVTDSSGYLTSNRANRKILDLYAFRVANERLFLSLLISGETLIESRIASRFVEVETLDLYAFRAEDFEGYQIFDPVKRKKPKPPIIRKAERKDSLSVIHKNEEQKQFSQSVVSYNPLNSPAQPKTYDFEPIYFAFGSYFLDAKAKLALRSLSSYLKEQEKTELNVLAFTDPLGTEEFNLQLATRRAEQVKIFLVSQGLSEARIRVKSRGEIIADDTSWFERIFQRRVEIILESPSQIEPRKANHFVLKKELDLERVCELLAISSDELVQWNQLENKKLEMGSLIRVFGRSLADLRLLAMQNDLNRKFTIHQVKANEKLSEIAYAYSLPEELIIAANRHKLPIKPGTRLLIYGR